MSSMGFFDEQLHPITDEDMECIINEERASRARESIRPDDLLAVVQDIQLSIGEESKHPLWELIQHCCRTGTLKETGKMPHMAEQVGVAFLPLIDKAIARLVGEKIDDFSAWDVA